jgi:hypothetical protein
MLESSGFSSVIECGLGGKLTDFDKISMHTFPGSHKTPSEMWELKQDDRKTLHPAVHKDFASRTDNPCGILADSLASTSISTSFVGAFAASLVIAESVRALNGGKRYDTITIQLRSLNYKKAFLHKKSSFLLDLATNGFTEIKIVTG